MIREIKFRAWDKENNIMSSGLPFEWFINGEDEDMEFPKSEESLPLKDFKHYFSDFILMQFTGLKDKNGKEIYEGDIVRYRTVVRTTQTHTGDNIPNGSYTEPMEPAIETTEAPVIFSDGIFHLDEESLYDYKSPLSQLDRRWTEEEIKDTIAIYKQGKVYSIWDNPEEGDLQYLLEEYKLSSLADLIEYVSGIEVVGNIYENENPELLNKEQNAQECDASKD